MKRLRGNMWWFHRFVFIKMSKWQVPLQGPRYEIVLLINSLIFSFQPLVVFSRRIDEKKTQFSHNESIIGDDERTTNKRVLHLPNNQYGFFSGTHISPVSLWQHKCSRFFPLLNIWYISIAYVDAFIWKKTFFNRVAP